MRATVTESAIKRAGVFTFAVILVCSLSFPSLAFAVVRVDEQELEQGENAVGGGVATFVDTTLDMVGVVANQLYTDESLTVNFNGGNGIRSVDIA